MYYSANLKNKALKDHTFHEKFFKPKHENKKLLKLNQNHNSF